MKCPKCGYLGFDAVDRCRNCGYDFSLSRGVAAPELPLRAEPEPEADGFADLSLVAPRKERPPTPDLDSDLDRILRSSPLAPLEPVLASPSSASPFAPEPALPPRREPAPVAAPASRVAPVVTVPEAAPVVAAAPAAPVPDSALPLFGGPITDDVPLITKASPPRPPLAVRRATPEVPRVRAEAPRAPAVDLRLDLEAADPTAPIVDASARARAVAWPQATPEAADDAPIVARVVAAAIDIVILALVDAIVVYFTMQICGLTTAELALLPKVPLIAFLAAQNGGYLVAFTVGGQTLGKMIAGIRVVTADSGSSLDVGRAVLRTFAWVVLAVPAGLGFLPAVFSADHRGLHDRIAGSRVVRAFA